jgi:hypothetical protein
MLTRPEYTSLLTKEERAAAMKMGAIVKFSEHGIRPGQIDMIKEAGKLADAMKFLIGASLLTGIPTGILAHKLQRGATQHRGKEQELDEKIKYYNQATEELESGLAGLGSTPSL